MRLHIQWLQLFLFIALSLMLSAFGGLAGFFSLFISVLLPLYALFALLYLLVSWEKYAWYQTFSTNHPHKGESIRFEIHLANDGCFPLSGGTCRFVIPGKEQQLPLPVGFLPGMPAHSTYTEDIACPYRGTYTAGIRAIILRTPLGIIQVEIITQPQIFYVFPELYTPGSSLEAYMTTIGSMLPGERIGMGDTSVFEYATPLREQMPSRGILWKRWAATGIPSCAVYGETRSRGIAIVIDLYPCCPEPEAQEKLAAEDILMSAAFSVMRYLASHRISVRLFCGSEQEGTLIDSEEAFRKLYDRSANIIFSDTSFPAAAFAEENTAMLFSARPIEALYGEYKKKLGAGTEPHLFLCPPQSLFKRESARSRILQEERLKAGSKSFFYIADARKGGKEVTDAFR
ncbi:MAG TPA: hypothetical protein DDW78_04355 [Treponema sp.]|nr:hypothetical protein [Treponema sp.]